MINFLQRSVTALVIIIISLVWYAGLFSPVFADAILTSGDLTNPTDHAVGSVNSTGGTVYGLFFNPSGNYAGAKGVGAFDESFTGIVGATPSGAWHFVGSKGGDCVGGTYAACIISSDFTIEDKCFGFNSPGICTAGSGTTVSKTRFVAYWW